MFPLGGLEFSEPAAGLGEAYLALARQQHQQGLYGAAVVSIASAIRVLEMATSETRLA